MEKWKLYPLTQAFFGSSEMSLRIDAGVWMRIGELSKI